MPSDVAVALAKDLVNRILSNISAGIHPADPAPLVSLLQYFSRKIQPVVAEKWEETDMYLNERNHGQEPPLQFYREVTKDLFDKLSNEEREQLSKDMDRDLLLAEDNHKITIQRMYGEAQNDDGELALALPGVLRSTMIALEALTGMNFLIWVGESQPGHRIRLVQATSSSTMSEETFIVPSSPLNSSIQKTHMMMQNTYNTFLHQCIKPPTLPSHLFRGTAAQPPDNNSQSLDRGTQKRKHGSVFASPDPSSASTPSKRQRSISSVSPPSVSLFRSSKELRRTSNSRNPTGPFPPALILGSASATPLLQHSRSNPTGGTAANPVSSMTQHSLGTTTSPLNPPASTSLLRTPPFQKTTLIVTPLSKSKGTPSGLPKLVSIKDLLGTIPKAGEWLLRALSSITQTHLGFAYYDLVKLLITLEALHGYTNRRGAPHLSHIDRPSEVTMWVKTGRGRWRTEVEDIQAYAITWWKWWTSLQPKWRRFDKMGLPLTVLPTGGVADWTCLLLPGMNGFLSVVASLYFWGCAERLRKGKEKDNGNGWDKAVRDCTWVMEHLVSTMEERGGNENAGVD